MISYKSLIIFYFSGTGNAKRISEQIIDISKEKGLNTELFDITKIGEDNFPEIKEDTLIGFCSPTHGFNMPPIMLKFIRKFKKRKTKNTKVFILNTRAGMKLYKLFTPGISGIALILPALILKLKAYNVVGYRPIDMPSNWISLHPGLRTSVVRSIDERCSRITKRFTEKILSGKNVLRGLISLPVDIALIPVSTGYYFIGRFGLAKTFIATDKCNNCGLCIKQCPVNAISEIKGINFWAFTCESCMKCMNTCPKRAIETAHGYTFLLWWLIMSVLTNLLVKYIVEFQFMKEIVSVIKESGIKNIILIAVIFSGLFIGYRILHFLMRFKLFNRIIAYTSLTHYKFWRRYKATSNN
ncbi:MAG: EFR1 family ferrodoxin [Bacteroidales bacterium]|nr:EFR1 family ferrodoxin [Bacteroidales bacterium]